MTIKYRVLIMKTFNGQLTNIGKKNFKIKDPQFRFKGQTFLINPSLPAFRKKNTIHYEYDIDSGQIIRNTESFNISPEIIDNIFNKEALLQLANALPKSKMFDMSIIGALICILLGLFIGIFLGPYLPMPGA